MARKPTGQIIERTGPRGRVFAIRYRAAGKRWYETLNVKTRDEADDALAGVRDRLREGTWTPPESAPPIITVPTEDVLFDEFAAEWLAGRQAEGLAAKTLSDFRWSLTLHLLPYFADYPVSAISVRVIDAYKTDKARERTAIEAERAAAHARGERFTERGLSNSSINHTLRHLAAILEQAVDEELLATNPAMGRRRRLKTEKPKRPWVEPQQLPAFLDAAPNKVGRVLLELLCATGLRIDEALSLRFRDLDLGTGHLYVTKAKTPKGVRRIPLPPALRETLTLWKVDAKHAGSDDYVIHTSTGHRHHASNLRRDVLSVAIAAADRELDAAGIRPIGHVTFHGLRRTFASLRSYLGKPIRQTADLLGHEDVRFTLNVYAQSPLEPDEMSTRVRQAFERGLDWARMGTNEPLTVSAFDAAAAEA